MNLIFDYLINLDETTYEETSQFFVQNSYIRTEKGIEEFVSILPFIIDCKSSSIGLVTNIVHNYYQSFSDEKIQNRIKKQLFLELFHLPSRNEPISNIKENSGQFKKIDSKAVFPSRSFTRAYFLRSLYELSVYTIYEITNSIHQFWEKIHSASTQSALFKYMDNSALVSLLVWFAPEIDTISNTFYTDLYKVARKMLYSRKLPKAYIAFINKIDIYRDDGKWTKLKEKILLRENHNVIIKILKNDDAKCLQSYISKKKEKTGNYSFLGKPVYDISHNPYWFLHYESTTLQMAAYFGSNKCFDYLMTNHLDNIAIDKQNELGLDVFDFAGAGNSKEIILSLKNRNYDVSKSIRMAFLFHHNELAHFLCNEYKLNPQSFLPEIIASHNISALQSNQFTDLPEFNLTTEKLFEISAQYGSFLFFDSNSLNIAKSTLEKILLTATEHGHTLYVNKILEYVKQRKLNIPNEFNINAKNDQNKTSLQIAVEMGNFNIARSFIKSKELFGYDYKIDLNIKIEETGQSLLHTCVLMNLIDIAKLLLDSPDFDVNITDNENATALHYATRNVNTIGTHLVVDLSTVKDDFLITTEHYIFNYGKLINLEMFTLFAMEKRVNFNVFDNYGLAPLHYIGKSGRADYLVILRKYRVEFKYVGKGEAVEPPELMLTSRIAMRNAMITKRYHEMPNSKSNPNLKSYTKQSAEDNSTNQPVSKTQNMQHSVCTENCSNINKPQTQKDATDSNDSDDDSHNENKPHLFSRVLLNKYRPPDWEMHSDVDFRIKSKTDQKTPLLYSAENERANNVIFLVSLLPDCTKDTDITGRNVVHICSALGNSYCLRVIGELEDSEIYNDLDKWDHNSVQIASAKGRTACLRILLVLENIDISHKDANGFTAYEIAKGHSYYLSCQLIDFLSANNID